jgi:hypothetical protein
MVDPSVHFLSIERDKGTQENWADVHRDNARMGLWAGGSPAQGVYFVKYISLKGLGHEIELGWNVVWLALVRRESGRYSFFF